MKKTTLPELKVGSLVKLKPKQDEIKGLLNWNYNPELLVKTGWLPVEEVAEKLLDQTPQNWSEDWRWVIFTNNLTKTSYKDKDYWGCLIENRSWDRQFWKTNSKDSLFLVLELKESVKRLEEPLDIAIQLDKETPGFSLVDFAIVVPVQDTNREFPIWIPTNEVEVVDS